MSNDAERELRDVLAGMRPFLRELVDHVWGVAHEDHSVPATDWADRMIDEALVTASTDALAALRRVRPAQGWSERERAAMDELTASQQLSEHAVLRQGLRWYQLAVRMAKRGFPIVRWQAYDGTLMPRETKLPEPTPDQTEYLDRMIKSSEYDPSIVIGGPSPPSLEPEAQGNGVTEETGLTDAFLVDLARALNRLGMYSNIVGLRAALTATMTEHRTALRAALSRRK